MNCIFTWMHTQVWWYFSWRSLTWALTWSGQYHMPLSSRASGLILEPSPTQDQDLIMCFRWPLYLAGIMDYVSRCYHLYCRSLWVKPRGDGRTVDVKRMRPPLPVVLLLLVPRGSRFQSCWVDVASTSFGSSWSLERHAAAREVTHRLVE